jgi:hypothetical protein
VSRACGPKRAFLYEPQPALGLALNRHSAQTN